MNAQEIKDYEVIVEESNKERVELEAAYTRGTWYAFASAIGVGALAYLVGLRMVDCSIEKKDKQRLDKAHTKISELVYKNQTKEE